MRKVIPPPATPRLSAPPRRGNGLVAGGGIIAVDLFCGAGGTSTGLAEACKELGIPVDLLAINHWSIAVETHRKNHPWARHLCSRIQDVDPRTVVPSGRLTLLVASPECTHHSIARGGRPVNDQLRASAWLVLKWLQELYVENLLIENVREFRDWGPIGANGRPLKKLKGETYRAFVRAIESLGYRIEERLLNAADYGDATSRRRLFLLARRPAHKRIEWPEPTHTEKKSAGLFKRLKPWRAAREIIDWRLPGTSIFARKKPLSAKTLARIEAGLRKFGGTAAEPFLVILRGTSKTRSIHSPIPTVTAGGGHVGVCAPYLVSLEHHGSNSALRSASQSTSGAQVRGMQDPVPTITTRSQIALCQPFILAHRIFKKEQIDSIDAPLRTLTTTARDIKLVQPFLITAGGPQGQGRQPQGVGKPLPTVITENHRALVQPFVVDLCHGDGEGRRTHSVGAPLPTVTTADGMSIVVPHLVKFYGDPASQNQSVEQPLDTVTTRDRFGLVQPRREEQGACYAIDILFRMLQPHELAAAMGFERSYAFSGCRSDQVKQIGNAVPVGLAKALCMSLLSEAAQRQQPENLAA